LGVPIGRRRRRGRRLAAGAAIEVLGIEVVQTIQNLAHEVPLIRGKTTVVRVYIRCAGFRAARIIRGEIKVAAVPGGPARYLASMNTPKISDDSQGDLPAQRRDVGLSLNFMLPADVSLWPEIDIAVNHLRSEDTDLPLIGETTVHVTTVEAPPFRIKVVGLRYVWTRPGVGPVEVSPEALQFDFLRSFLARAYPVPGLEWSQIVVQANPLFAPPFADPSGPPIDLIWGAKRDLAHNQLAALRAKGIEAGEDPRTHYYGLVSDASAGLFFRGAAKDIPAGPDPSIVAVGPTGDPRQYSSLSWDKDGSYGDWYAAHELSHTLGRYHPGFCGQDASDTAFPYPDGRISTAQHGDIIGLDIGDAALGIQMAALAHETCHDIMTYCNDQWMSSHSYLAILDRLRAEDAALQP
jgi:hypothetical protein